MAEVVQYQTDGVPVLVEVEDESFGVERVHRGADGVVPSGRTLADALAGVKDAARTAVEALRDLSPDQVEMEFGVKLAGEAGALIAKTSAEGHFTVKMTWTRADQDAQGGQGGAR